MGEYLPKSLPAWISRVKGKKLSRNSKIRKGLILMLGMGLFFYSFSETLWAKQKGSFLAPREFAGLTVVKKVGEYNYVSKKAPKAPAIAGCVEASQTKPKNTGKKVAEIPNRLDANVVSPLVAGHPIEEMVPFIAKREKRVGAFLVAIAKKESNWGKHSPKKDGKECYNYWGYRGTYNQTASGYSCFDSPEQAIQQVGDRIETLVNKQVNTPERMIVWKCGSTCAGHDPAGVSKWISDVRSYYAKLNS